MGGGGGGRGDRASVEREKGGGVEREVGCSDGRREEGGGVRVGEKGGAVRVGERTMKCIGGGGGKCIVVTGRKVVCGKVKIFDNEMVDLILYRMPSTSSSDMLFTLNPNPDPDMMNAIQLIRFITAQ